MDRFKRTWMMPVLVVTATIAALAVMTRGDDTERPPLDLSAVEQIEPASHEIADEIAGEHAPEIDATRQSSGSCRGQQLQVVLDGKIESACMGAIVTKYNGSVRSHQAATLSTPPRWLRVEFAGGTILSAAWGSEVRPDFHCQAAGCKGITIAKPDARGARMMTFERAALMRTGSNGMQSTQDSLQLSGQLEIAPEALSEQACADQGVSIVTSDSSSQTFCPRGGAGFEIADDGSKRYRFTSLDGESILVATVGDHEIGQVQYQGEVSLACRSFECGSVRISMADAAGARRFTFSGTTLIDTNGGQSNAVLNGSLLLPPM